jgi:transcriptional regulator with XRE-family HTH domain
MTPKQRFGSFCREKRAALGLTLREFCRRNALDPGNVSRLERSLLAPPQSPDGLETYAKALQLQPGSEEWHTLLELAAFETGRIPSPVLEDKAAKDQLPRVMRDLRSKVTQDRPWVSSTDLESWANYRDAQAQFPQLIRRLIHATNETIGQIEFPAGDGIQSRGWDGIVMARDGTAFVPAGLSVWELGTGSDPKRKADDDFRGRTKNPLGVNPADATFILVTPRRWQGKGEWERVKDGLGPWRRVVVYDADTIESWLELAPAVDLWFAKLLGKRPSGTRGIDEHWENLAKLTSPNLKPQVFLASRQKDVASIESWLSEPPSAIAIESRSPIEAVDFFAAYLAAIGDAKRDRDVARTVIVETLDAWNSMADEPRSLNLIAAPALALDAETVSKALRNGHRVLLCASRFDNGPYRKLTLSRPSCLGLETALVDSGFDSRAVEKAEDCGGSLSVLKRRLARIPATIKPDWSHADPASEMAFLVLIGRWDESSAGDRAVVEELAGRPYANVAKSVQRWSEEIDPPVFRLLNEWTLTSREDSWLLLNRYLTNAQFEAWEHLAVTVLTNNDPRLDLPSGQRPFAPLSGKMPTYSDALRTGIAETLAVLATIPTDPPRSFSQSRVDRLVAQLFSGAPDWKRWSSLSNQLPLLAEASPVAFLEALDQDLRQPAPETLKLFADDDHTFFSRCEHASILWSLETLAWSEEHLLATSLILAKLAELDPGKKWGNRPIQSLTEIFTPWRPQTTVSLGSRLKVLKAIAKHRPGVGWQLMLNMLHSVDAMTMQTRQPKWRNWTAGNWPQEVPDAECFEQLEACGTLLIEMLETSPHRWNQLLMHIAGLPKSCRTVAIGKLLKMDKSVFRPDELKRVTDALRQQVRRNADHPTAAWAMPKDDIVQLREVLTHLESDDVVARHAWLFASRPEFPGSPLTAEALDKRDRQISEARQSALEEIYRQRGIEGILELADTLDDEYGAWFVGEALSRLNLVEEKRIIPKMLIDPSRRTINLARGFAHGCLQQEHWIDRQQLKDWSAEQVTALAGVLPPRMQTWQLIGAHSEAAGRLYWQTTPAPFGIADDSDCRHAAEMLLSHDRPFPAAIVLSSAVERKMAVDSEQIASVLEAALKIKPTSTADRSSDMRHAFETLIEYLQSLDPAFNGQRLAALEFAYLQILDGHPVTPVTLHKALSVDPKFFAGVIASAFYPTRATDHDRKKGDDERHRIVAENAYRVLHSWDRIPGQGDNGDIDDALLFQWVRRARELCRESDHLEICDLQLGELLAQSGHEPDGSWPQIAVRDVMEEFNSNELIEGFIIGTLNRRGAVSRSPFEGGNLERLEMEKYELFAKQCGGEWPNTAKALRALSQNYAERGQREDSEAEARRLGR